MARRAFFNFESREPEEVNFKFDKCEPIKAIFTIDKCEPIKATFTIDPPTVNYDLFINKPKINHVELVGDKSLEDLGIILAINNLIEEHNTSETAHEFIHNLIVQEVADREAADVIVNERIDDEIRDRTQADTELGNRISDEVQARISADQILQTNIDNEVRDREIADNTLHGEITVESIQREIQDNLLIGRIDSEATARENADTNINSRVDGINELIPAEASSSNKLVDTAYVIDLIKTNAASYRGSWATWAAVPTDPNLYPADAQGERTPNVNDYMIVTADETQDDGTWMYKYTGTWAIEGKDGWKAEYEIGKTPFTPEQQAAIDSGITSGLVTQIGVNKSDIEGINTTLSGFGNIVIHNVDEFATSAQGTLADSALQPNDNISELNNDAGYTSNKGTVTSVNDIEPVDGNVTIEIPDSATWGNIIGDLANQTDLQGALDDKVDKTTIADKVYGTDAQGNQTTYDVDSFGQVDDVTVGGTSVVTNKVAVLGSMAGETATDYATSAQGALAESAVQTINNIAPIDGNAIIGAGTGLQLSSQNDFNILQQDYGTPNPYTVYGSPVEISDKVYDISGSGNYVTADCNFTVSSYDTFEIIVKFKDISVRRYNSLCGNFRNGLYLRSSASAKVYGWSISSALGGDNNVNVETGSYFSSYDVSNNYCYIKLERTATKYIVYASKDGTTWTQTGTYSKGIQSSEVTISPFGFGNVASTTKMSAIIDFNGCSIKVNNDYIFNPANNIYKQVARATNSLYGLVKPDGTSITVNDGVISASITDNVQSTSTTSALSANMGKELQDQVDNLKARGRFLALWDCSTGLAETPPTVSPYLYQTGDYFIVGNIAQAGGTNYKPSGSSYTDNVPSTAVETEAVSVNDVYYYDGNVWRLQINTQKEIAFVNIAGDAYDNSNLASALNSKQNNLTAGNGINITNDLISNTGVLSISTGSTNGTINADINGTNTSIAVYGLGSSAYESTSYFATASQGSKADTAVQPEQLSTVATTGSYNDLIDKPEIGNATITLRQGGVLKGSFTLNQTVAETIDLDAGGTTGDYLPLTGGTLSGDLTVNNSFLVGKKSGYVRVAYVDMPAGAYVDSGYYGNLDSEIMFVGSAQASSNIVQFAGAITNTTKAIAINAGMTQNTTTRFGNRYVTNTSRLQVGQKVTITTNKSTYTMVDDTSAVLYSGTFGTPSEFTTATPILVGKADGSSNAVAKRIYVFIATENGEQKVALYPAKRVLDGVVGLFDVVSNTFLTNVGTGTFTGGEEIDDEIDFPVEYLVGDSITDAITFSDNGIEIKKEYSKDNDSYNIPNTKFVHKVTESKYDKVGGVVYGDIYGNQEIHSQDVLSVGVKNDGTAVSGITIYDKVQHTSFATATTPSSYSGPRITTGLSCKTTTKVILSYKPLVTQYQVAASARMLFLNDNQRISWEYGDGEVQTIVLQSEYNDSDSIAIGGATESYELYSVVILEGTKCVAHFVPAIQGTTKGMYDLQRKTFYGWSYSNSSATNVTYGTEVNPVGSYSIGTVSDVGLNFMTNGDNRLLIGNDGVVKLNQEVSSTATGKEIVTAEWVLAKLAELGG